LRDNTVSDLGVFAKALYTGSLLNPETHEARLQTQSIEGVPDFLGYGEGIEKLGNFWGHNGTIFGFSSDMYYLPERDQPS
jgi:D-alanyl-D-alanine carboxypeptidase